MSNEYYPLKTSTNSKITTLEEFDLALYGDLRNLGNKIDGVAANTSLNSNNITSLSNTLSYDYITTSDPNDQLMPTYIQKSKN